MYTIAHLNMEILIKFKDVDVNDIPINNQFKHQSLYKNAINNKDTMSTSGVRSKTAKHY